MQVLQLVDNLGPDDALFGILLLHASARAVTAAHAAGFVRVRRNRASLSEVRLVLSVLELLLWGENEGGEGLSCL